MDGKPFPSTSAATLLRAAEAYGSYAHLARALGVPQSDLTRWIEGNEAVPHEVVVRALELAERLLGEPRGKVRFRKDPGPGPD